MAARFVPASLRVADADTLHCHDSQGHVACELNMAEVLPARKQNCPEPLPPTPPPGSGGELSAPVVTLETNSEHQPKKRCPDERAFTPD